MEEKPTKNLVVSWARSHGYFEALLADESLAKQLTEEQLEEIRYLLNEQNELGISFSLLVAAIRINPVRISEEHLRLIDLLGREMELDPKGWSSLKAG